MTIFCPYCNRNVEGKKTFHGAAFLIIILFIWGPGAWLGFLAGTLSIYITQDPTIFGLWLLWMSSPIIYILYHIFGKTPRCPICNTKLSKITSEELSKPTSKPLPEVISLRELEDRVVNHNFLKKSEDEAAHARTQNNLEPTQKNSVFSRKSVLFAQIIFGGIGAFFTLTGVMGALTYRPSYWSTGPSPIVLVFIGLPLIAVTSLLNGIRKKEYVSKTSSFFQQIPENEKRIAEENLRQIHLQTQNKYCRYCRAEIPVDSVYCEKCGMQLKPVVESEYLEVSIKPEIVETPTEPEIVETEKEIIPQKQELKPIVEKHSIIESEEIEIFHEQAEIIIIKDIRLGMEQATLTKYKGEITLTNKKVITGIMDSGQMLLPIEGIINVKVLGTLEKSLGIHIESTMEGHRLNIEFELKSQNIDGWIQAFKKLPNVNIKRKWI